MKEYEEDYTDPDWDDDFVPQTSNLSDDMSRREIRNNIWQATRENYMGKRTKVLHRASAVYLLLVFGFMLSIKNDVPEKLGFSQQVTDRLLDVDIWLSIMGSMLAIVCASVNSYDKDQKDLYESIDTMLEMREQFPGIPADIDAKKLKRLISVLPVVLEHLSDSDRQVLDGLMNGSKNVMNDESRRDIAGKIMTDHLKSHPKDLEMLINAYRGVVDFEFARQAYRSQTLDVKR